MRIHVPLVAGLLLTSLASIRPLQARGASESQSITLSDKLKIPGASLKAGEYTFSVEDRLQDRAIVRITSKDSDKHFLLLTVPSSKLQGQGSDGLVRFTTPDGKDQFLKGWVCQSCSPGLEFVYPKAEAAKLTDASTESVLAVDPTFDKLPQNLSPDDMKVVTLWLLSPERISNNKGKGVKAEKYAGMAQPATSIQTASVSPGNTSELAQTPAPGQSAAAAEVSKPVVSAAAPVSTGTSELAQTPAPASTPSSATSAQPASTIATSSAPVQTASASIPEVNTPSSAENGPRRHRLPKTATADYAYLFGGVLLLSAGLASKLSRRFALSARI